MNYCFSLDQEYIINQIFLAWLQDMYLVMKTYTNENKFIKNFYISIYYILWEKCYQKIL